jgi:hypothetical protein
MIGNLNLNTYNQNYQNNKGNTNPLNNMNSMYQNYQMGGGEQGGYMTNPNMYMNQNPQNFSQNEFYQPNSQQLYDYKMLMQEQSLRYMSQNDMTPQEYISIC